MLDHEYDYRMKQERERHGPTQKPKLLQFTPGYSYRNDPSLLHVSSSRIQESYFDDEMQARVHKSARRRQRKLEEVQATAKKSKFESALSSTVSLMSTLGSFLHSGYSKVVDYVW